MLCSRRLHVIVLDVNELLVYHAFIEDDKQIWVAMKRLKPLYKQVAENASSPLLTLLPQSKQHFVLACFE